MTTCESSAVPKKKSPQNVGEILGDPAIPPPTHWTMHLSHCHCRSRGPERLQPKDLKSSETTQHKTSQKSHTSSWSQQQHLRQFTDSDCDATVKPSKEAVPVESWSFLMFFCLLVASTCKTVKLQDICVHQEHLILGPWPFVMICYGHVHFPFTSWIHLVDGRKHMHLVCGQVASDSPHPHQRGVHKYAFEPSWKRTIRAKETKHAASMQVLPHHVGSSLPELGQKYGAKLLLGKEMVSLHQNKLFLSSSVLLREWFLCSTFFVKLCSVVLIII